MTKKKTQDGSVIGAVKAAWETLLSNKRLAVLSSVIDMIFLVAVLIALREIAAKIITRIINVMPRMIVHFMNSWESMTISEFDYMISQIHAIGLYSLLFAGIVYILWSVTQSLNWIIAFRAVKRQVATVKYIGFFFWTSAVWILLVIALAWLDYRINAYMLQNYLSIFILPANIIVAAVAIIASYFMFAIYAVQKVKTGLRQAISRLRMLGLLYVGCCLATAAIIFTTLSLASTQFPVIGIVPLLLVFPLMFIFRIAYSQNTALKPLRGVR